MRLAALLAIPVFLHAEVRTLTLRQAIDLALEQAPEVALARLDQQKSRDQVTVLKDAFMKASFNTVT